MIDDARVRLEATLMLCDELRAVEDLYVMLEHEHLDAAVHELKRNAVADRVDIDEAVARNTTLHAALANADGALGK